MVKKKFIINWSKKSKASVKEIFDFYKFKSLQGAKNVKKDIMNSPKSILYAEQYQVDEFLGEPFRRMVVRHFKIIYKPKNEFEIRILQIFDTYQSPDKMRD